MASSIAASDAESAANMNVASSIAQSVTDSLASSESASSVVISSSATAIDVPSSSNVEMSSNGSNVSTVDLPNSAVINTNVINAQQMANNATTTGGQTNE